MIGDDLKKLAREIEEESSVILEDCVLLSLEKFEQRCDESTLLLSRDDFPAVFRAVFDDICVDQVQSILMNPFFIDRVFDFMCAGNSAPEGCGLDILAYARGLRQMFSPDDEQQARFRFAIYDLSGSGHVTEADVREVVGSFFEASLARVSVEKKHIGLGGGGRGTLSRSRPQANVDQTLWYARGELGREKLHDIVHNAFEIADLDKSGTLEFDEFRVAFLRSSDSFSWEGLTAKLLDAVEHVVRRPATFHFDSLS